MRIATGVGLPVLVLFDRDGTLIENEPAIRSAGQVVPMPGAIDAVLALRAAGIAIGVATNQPRLGEGTLRPSELADIHARIEALFGPIAVWAICPHLPDDACVCRKPKPGSILQALQSVRVAARDCVVVGDIGSDIAAAQAAGARAVLVPTAVTLRSEVQSAPAVAPDLRGAVDLILACAV